MAEEKCHACSREAHFQCKHCKQARYCDKNCQWRAWASGQHYCAHVTFDKFVPHDGREEYSVQSRFLLRAGTTLFHSRVNPSPALNAGGDQVFSHYFGLTLSHPCTVLLQHIFVDPSRPTGGAVIFEYETLAPLQLRPYGFRKYDEVYLQNLSTQNFPSSLRVSRAYNINRKLLERSAILAFMHGHDGFPAPTSIAGRWHEPPMSDALHLVTIGVPHFDGDYLHMRQFWEKSNIAGTMSANAMTLQAILCGSDLTGPPALQRHAYYVYDDASVRFQFETPVEYRDDDSERADMPNVVAILVAYTGTRNYDRTGGFTPSPERQRFAPIQHQGEILGMVVEEGYERRVYPIIDQLLSELPWEEGHPVRFKWSAEKRANLPLFQATLEDKEIVTV